VPYLLTDILESEAVYECALLDMLGKLRKATISFVMYVRPSVRME